MQSVKNRYLVNGVNLLRESAVETLEELQVKKTVYMLTLIGSLVLVVVSILVFMVSLNLNEKAKELRDSDVKWTERIKALSDVESYNFSISKKMASIKKIEDTADFYSIFSTLNTVIPVNVNITQLVSGNDGQLNIEGESLDSVSLITFFDGLINSDKAKLRNVILNNLVLTKDGLYRFSLGAKYFKNR